MNYDKMCLSDDEWKYLSLDPAEHAAAAERLYATGTPDRQRQLREAGVVTANGEAVMALNQRPRPAAASSSPGIIGAAVQHFRRPRRLRV